MERKIIYVVLAAVLAGCTGGGPTAADHGAGTDGQGTVADRFTDELRLKTTPVKDQGASSLCWAYAMLATIETEHLMQGDSVNLSPDFVARHFLCEQALEYRYLWQASRTPPPPITTRGIGSMLPRLIGTYGLTHYDAYNSHTDYYVLCRKLQQMCRWAGPANRSLGGLRERTEQLLDEEIAPAPRHVFMLGAEYTALEFAHSVCRADEYVSLTSFTHHPFGQCFPLEIPDNRYHDTFLNLPIDTLMARIDRSLRSGHPVCWEGDISEPGFSFARGTARLTQADGPVTQERRQQAFERRLTTDDHCMEIVGIAHDARQRKYYLMKNSWGSQNPYGGYMYVSADYVRLKTIAVFLPAS